MKTPAFTTLQVDALPPARRAELAPLLRQLTQVLSGVSSALDHRLTVADNLAALVATVVVDLPAAAPSPGGGGWATPWTDFAVFSHSWTAYGLPFANPGWRRSNDGLVYLRGMLTGGTLGQYAVVLSAGARPAFQVMTAAPAGAGSSDMHGRCDIWTTGEVFPVSGGNTYFSLDNIVFPTP